MLDKSDIQDAVLVDCLQRNYALFIQKITFLPLGADRNTAVYRAYAKVDMAYFIKLRRDDFNEMSLVVPKLLSEQGVLHIIAPLAATNGALWVSVNDFHLSVYPFVAGQDAHEARMSDAHWMELGCTLKSIHSLKITPELVARIPRETFSGEWRERVRLFQNQVEFATFDDSISAELAKLLREKRSLVDTLVDRAEQLGATLQAKLPPFVLCHADIHQWNVLIQADGTFYVVDWDTIILAPKERDLMFVASGLFGKARTPEQEEALFYQGYGDMTQADPIGLAYYRCERIVRDIAEFCEEILLTEPGRDNRAQALKYFVNQFEPRQVIEIALRSARGAEPPAANVVFR